MVYILWIFHQRNPEYKDEIDIFETALGKKPKKGFYFIRCCNF